MLRRMAGLLVLCLTLQLPGPPSARAEGLTAWQGFWKGPCRLDPPYRGIRDFRGSLRVRGLGPGGRRYSWVLVYDYGAARPKETRTYEIVAKDASRGHWVIDEKNGLKLDTFLLGNRLYSPFTINRLLITATYERTGTAIRIELPTYSAKPIRRTCLTGNANLCASSHALYRMQTCVFRKAN